MLVLLCQASGRPNRTKPSKIINVRSVVQMEEQRKFKSTDNAGAETALIFQKTTTQTPTKRSISKFPVLERNLLGFRTVLSCNPSDLFSCLQRAFVLIGGERNPETDSSSSSWREAQM